MTRPVDLITANTAHEIHDRIAMIEAATGDKKPPAVRAEVFSRQLLCNIAHEASERDVMRALASLGAPATEADLLARLAAAGEAQRQTEEKLQ